MASANPVARAVWHSLSPERKSAVLGAYRRFDFRFEDWNRRATRPPNAVRRGLRRRSSAYATTTPRTGKLLEKLLGYPPPWEARNEAAPVSGATGDPEAVRK